MLTMLVGAALLTMLIEALAKDLKLPALQRQASYSTWMVLAAAIFHILLDLLAALT